MIRDSPYLLKRSFLYNQEIDKLKDQEREQLYNLTLECIKRLFKEDHDIEDLDLQPNELDASQVSPMKDFNEQLYEETFSMLSDSKPFGKFQTDNMDCDENASLKDESVFNNTNSYCENRSYLSHSSYMEDIEPEIRDLLGKDSFKSPRKRQRLAGYDQNVGALLNKQDSDGSQNDLVKLALRFSNFDILNFCPNEMFSLRVPR